MLNHIEGKENKMYLTVTQIFNSLTDKDFIMMHETGQLKTFCDALSLDLNTDHEKNNSYSA